MGGVYEMPTGPWSIGDLIVDELGSIIPGELSDMTCHFPQYNKSRNTGLIQVMMNNELARWADHVLKPGDKIRYVGKVVEDEGDLQVQAKWLELYRRKGHKIKVPLSIGELPNWIGTDKSEEVELCQFLITGMMQPRLASTGALLAG